MFPRLVAQGDLDEAWLAAARRNIALRRFGTAEEAGEAVAFLASSRASYLTGQRLMLDGGYTL
jgi:NAD(P)-dependent dehydrogenase (short-subunit alcohol dehydrogenase family)